MKPGGSKIKGHNFERKVAKILSNWWGVKDSFVRTPGSGAYAKFVGDDLKERLRCDLITPKEFPFIVECKCVESFEFHLLLQDFEKSIFKKWMDELEEKINKLNVSYKPMLIFSRNRWKTFIALRKKDYIDFKMNLSKKIVLEVGQKSYVLFLLNDFIKEVSKNILIKNGK